MAEIFEMSAADLLEAYRAKDLTRREVVESQLARCDEVNPTVNGVIYRFDERALREADEADQQVGDRGHLPLDGVPVTVSEIYRVEGCPEPFGMPAMESNVAETDDIIVERLRKAGAIIIGKTAIPEGFFRWNSVSTLFGETRSARDPACSAGGSGGGAATAVAAGIVPLAFHGDGGGSLRVPASWCDVLAMRTSPGVAPFPTPVPTPLTMTTLTTLGPFARTFDDIWRATRVLAGAHPSHPRAIPYEVLPKELRSETPRPRALRLAPDALGARVETEVIREVDRVAEALVEAGYEVVDDSPPPSMKEIPNLWNGIVGTTFMQFVQPALGDMLSDSVKHFIKAVYGPHELGDLAQWTGMEQRLYAIESEMGDFMDQYPLIICPVSGYRRPPIDYDYNLSDSDAQKLFDHQRWSVWVNTLNLPAVALGNDVQIVGRRWYDAEVACAASDVLKMLDPIRVANPHQAVG